MKSIHRLCLAIILCLAFAVPGFAAESTTPTYYNPGRQAFVVKIAWVAAAGATHADYAIPSAAMDVILAGGYYLFKARTVPSGVAVPAANYDLTLDTANGFDVLDGNLANRSDTATEIAVPSVYAEPIVDQLTVTFANLGANGAGDLYLYFARY